MSAITRMNQTMNVRLICRLLLIGLVLAIAFNDVASAASKKFIKGFILGALLAKGGHYPVVVHEHKHKGGF